MVEKTNYLIDRLHTSQILVGLDVGFKTIGIAVSDQSLTIASPLNTVNRKGTEKDLLKIKEYLIDYEIGGFVLGLPLNLNSSENKQTKNVRILGDKLYTFFSVDVDYWDERYSSDVIFKEMRKSNFSATKIKKKIRSTICFLYFARIFR